MSTQLRAALSGAAAPIAVVPVETMLIGAAVVAGAGAVIAGVLAVRGGRRRAPPEEPAVRRAPSPSSLGMADDPIVAAIGVPAKDARHRPDS